MANRGDHHLSDRGRRLIHDGSFSEYLMLHHQRDQTADYHPVTNPDGYLALCVAENKLVSDLLINRIARIGPPPETALGYDDMVGSKTFRRRLATFLERTFVGRRIKPGHLVTLAGAGSILETLFYAIADPGDGVLIPTPSYAAFWSDLGIRDQLTIVRVDGTSDDDFAISTDVLDEAMDRADRPIRALLFTSPSNPLGQVYSAEQIEEIVDWTDRRGIHLVMDEIYALSIYGETPFTSVARVTERLGERIHVIWAFSKDFGMSGFRTGVLWSENKEVLAAVDGLAYWSAVSGLTQHVLGEMIASDTWVDAYLSDMRTRLRASHDQTLTRLTKLGVGAVPAGGGIFLFCDFRQFLDEPTWEAEQRLWRRLLDEANVNLTPGSACRAGEPGWMRVCFASQPLAYVGEAFDRLEAVLG